MTPQTVARLLLMLVIPLLAGHAALAGEIYRIEQPDGSVLFTDRPQPGSNTIELDPGNHFNARAPARADDSDRPATPENADTAAEGAGPQHELNIVEPAAEAGVRAPAGRFQTTIEIDPTPPADYQLRGTLNGNGFGPVAAAPRVTLQLQSRQRGEQQLQVRLLDGGGADAGAAAERRFSIIRRSIQQPAPANPAPNWQPPD